MADKKKSSKKKKKKKKHKPDLMLLEDRVQELFDWMEENPQKVIKERYQLQNRMLKKRVIFGDTLLPSTLMPMFLRPESLQMIEEASVMMDQVLDKTIDLYFEEEEVREYFPYSELPQTWREAHPGYSKPTVINRHDALFDGENLKFIEFNCDNPGGKGWVDVYEEIFLENPLYEDLIGDFGRPHKKRITEGYFQAVMDCFEEMDFEVDPRVALVDFRQISARTESEILRDFFIEKGVEANLIDARDFELRKGRLYSNDVCFPIVLRALTSKFYMRFPRELKDFIEGAISQAACVVNSFRATLGSEKSVMAFLTNPFHFHYFTDEEVEAIKKHIPWTRRLDETITQSPDGEEINLKSFLKAEKDRLVLKPSSGAGGYDVILGKSAERAEWDGAVDNQLGCPWWIVQEAVEIPHTEFPVIRKNEIVREKKYFNFSPFVFGGKYVGLLGRTSDQDVINVSSGGGVIPVYPVRKD